MSENPEQQVPIQEEKPLENQQIQQIEQPVQNIQTEPVGTESLPKQEEESKIEQSSMAIENKEKNEQEDRDAKLAEALQFDSALMDQQHELIRKEIEDESPLVSDILPLQMLEFEFAQNEPFLKKVKNLVKKYPDYRKIRRDGSCFYRSFLFRLSESLIKKKDKTLLDKFYETVKDKSFLMQAGFEEFVIEDFQQPLIDVLDSIKEGKLSELSLQETFCDKVKSDSFVMYMRLITSAYLRNNAILYEHFIDNGLPMDIFCQTEVEPIDKDCDQLQITAIINHLNIPIKIIYLDSNPNKDVPDEIYIPEDCDKSKVFITFLYRPGHYDLLYS